MKKEEIQEILWNLISDEDREFLKEEFEVESWKGLGARELDEVTIVASDDYAVKYVAEERDFEGGTLRVYKILNKKTEEEFYFGWGGYYTSYSGYDWDDDLLLFKPRQKTITVYDTIQ